MPGIAIKAPTKRYDDVAAAEDLSLGVKPGELGSLVAIVLDVPCQELVAHFI